MAVLTPDSEASVMHELAFNLVRDGRSPDEVVDQLPARGGEDDDAALWLYSWALAQQFDERPVPRIALPAVTE
jgi:hypothetical protein